MVIYSRFTRLDSPKTTNVSLSDTGKLQIIIQINYINIMSKFCSIYLRPEVLCSKCVFLDFVFVYLASINHRVNYYYYDYCLIFSILDAVAFVASLIGKRLPFLGLTDSQRKQRAQEVCLSCINQPSQSVYILRPLYLTLTQQIR